MPTAAQFKCQVHDKKKPRPAWGNGTGGWVGGAWKTRFGAQKPTKGDPGWMMSKDGRAWTPGPGRYSDGNPHGSSVRYEKLKHSFFAGTLDLQKPRWPGDFTPTLGQAGGVVVNPVRGFSMGTGFSAGQTLVHKHEEVGKRTKGFTYQGLAPDLNMGEASVSTRGPAPGLPARPAGGPRPGTRFVPPKAGTNPSCQVFNTALGSAHMLDPNSYPGPGNYGSDYTFSNIGIRDNPVGKITGHEFPPAYPFGSAHQRPPTEISDVPGPAAYETDGAFVHATQFIPGKGHYITSKSIGGKMLGDRRPDPAESSDNPGPAAYHPEGAYDSLAHLRRSDFCEIKLVPGAERAEAEETPGPQTYDLTSSIEGGMPLRTGRQHALGGDKALGFGSRWSGFGEDRSDMPGPGKYWIHEPVWTGGMAPEHPAWTIPFGERPPLNPPSDGPGPAGYEGMGDIPVTCRGDVFLGDERGPGWGFAKGARASLMEGGEGSNKLYLPRTTRDGGVMVGDEKAEGVKIGQGPRRGAWEEQAGEGSGKLYLLPDPFREDLRFEWEPFKSVPRENGPLAHQPRERPGKQAAMPLRFSTGGGARRKEAMEVVEEGPGGRVAGDGDGEGEAEEEGRGEEAEQAAASPSGGGGGWGGAEFARMRVAELEEGGEGGREEAQGARGSQVAATRGRSGRGRREGGGRAAGRRRRGGGGAEEGEDASAWFPELQFAEVAREEEEAAAAAAAAERDAGQASDGHGERGGRAAEEGREEGASRAGGVAGGAGEFEVERGRRRVVYDGAEESERSRAAARFEVEEGRRQVAPRGRLGGESARAAEEEAARGGRSEGRGGEEEGGGVEFTTASEEALGGGVGGGGGFAWTGGGGRERRRRRQAGGGAAVSPEESVEPEAAREAELPPAHGGERAATGTEAGGSSAAPGEREGGPGMGADEAARGVDDAAAQRRGGASRRRRVQRGLQ